MNRVAKQYVLPYLWITLASAVYAVGFNWCYEPNQIGFGGITGVGQIINHILPWAPIGTVVIILNIPLFLLGWKLLGGHLLVSSLYSMFISSIFIDILHMIHTFEPMEPILGCIFGGVIMGGSLGVVFLQGATTGGTDLIARLLKLKLAWLPMGRLLLAVDLLVIVAVAVAWLLLAVCDVWAEYPGYAMLLVEGVQIFDGVDTLQEMELAPLSEGESSLIQNQTWEIPGQNL